MSSGRRAGPKPQQQPGAKASAGEPVDQFLPPLKPRPILTIALLAVLAAWLVGLVAMRMTAVRPANNVTSAPATR